MTLIISLVCFGLLALSLGTTAVPLTSVQDSEQVKREKDGLTVLKEVLSTLQSMDESTVSEAGKLSEIMEQKLSGEQSQEVVSHEKASNQEARHRAFLQHALRVGLMQLSHDAHRDSNQRLRAHQQRGKRSPRATTKRSATAHTSQDFFDYFGDYDFSDYFGYDFPDYHYDGLDCYHDHSYDIYPPYYPSPYYPYYDYNYDYGYGDYNPFCVCKGKASSSEAKGQQGGGKGRLALGQRG